MRTHPRSLMCVCLKAYDSSIQMRRCNIQLRALARAHSTSILIYLLFFFFFLSSSSNSRQSNGWKKMNLKNLYSNKQRRKISMDVTRAPVDIELYLGRLELLERKKTSKYTRQIIQKSLFAYVLYSKKKRKNTGKVKEKRGVREKKKKKKRNYERRCCTIRR